MALDIGAIRTGYVTRLVPTDAFDTAVDAFIGELVAMPPGPLAMTRAMTAAIGRTGPAFAAAWADADIQQWTFSEDEYRETARRYLNR